MDKDEARTLLTEHLVGYRARSHADLTATMGNLGCVEVTGLSGAEYQIEVDVLWDDKKSGNARLWHEALNRYAAQFRQKHPNNRTSLPSS